MMHKSYLILLAAVSFIVVLVFSGCEVQNPVSEDAVHPYLSGLSVPDTIRIGSPSPSAVRVRVQDPQGLSDIAAVRFSVLDASGQVRHEAEMADDGKNGDIIAGDGLFYGLLFPAVFSGRTGRFAIRVIAVDRSGHESDPAADSTVVAAGAPNDPPRLSHPVFPVLPDLEELENAYFEITVFDPQDPGEVDSVWCDVYPPYSPAPSCRLQLNDQGEDGDSTAGDGRFAVRRDLRPVFLSSGDYTFRFQARDRRGLESRPFVGVTAVIRRNDPPVLSKLQAPDRISRNAGEPILLTVEAIDPQGPDDILRVYFNTFRPDGSASQGNPFLMTDDGTQGDAEAGDGIYSLMIGIGPQNALGIYRFDFYAEDRGSLTSEVIRHEMEVTE
ncbi:MAG TPA: hypothetical protein ENN17_10505 [bacterium]|nr:hypothetical protein [bacterium]